MKIDVTEENARMLAEIVRLTNLLREAARAAGLDVPVADTNEVLDRILSAELKEIRFDARTSIIKSRKPEGGPKK